MFWNKTAIGHEKTLTNIQERIKSLHVSVMLSQDGVSAKLDTLTEELGKLREIAANLSRLRVA